MNYAGDFGHEITVLTGEEEISSDLSVSFHIGLNKIKQVCDDINYFKMIEK